MNMKKLEDKIRRITGNEKFKISSEEYYYPIKDLLDNMLSDLVQIKIIENLLKRKHYNMKMKFLNLIEELCNNNEFYKLVDDDLPCLKSILDYKNENEENKIVIDELIRWIEEWLNDLIITKDDGDIFHLLNEQFKIFYNTRIEKKE